jgi:hypothetical protein
LCVPGVVTIGPGVAAGRYGWGQTRREEENHMGFNPRDAIESVKDIATNAVERSADIVDSAGHILKGDVSAGVEGIVSSSMDIATHSVHKIKEIATGRGDDLDDLA